MTDLGVVEGRIPVGRAGGNGGDAGADRNIDEGEEEENDGEREKNPCAHAPMPVRPHAHTPTRPCAHADAPMRPHRSAHATLMSSPSSYLLLLVLLLLLLVLSSRTREGKRETKEREREREESEYKVQPFVQKKIRKNPEPLFSNFQIVFHFDQPNEIEI